MSGFRMRCCRSRQWRTSEENSTLTNSSGSDTFIGLIENSRGLQTDMNVQGKSSLQQEFALVGVQLGVEQGNLRSRERNTLNDNHFACPHLQPSADRGEPRIRQSEEATPRQTEPKKNKKKKNFLYSVDSREKQVPNLSHTRDIRDGEGVHERVGGRERERGGEGAGESGGGGEGEVLQATGYLSLHNGVSYEKTSVNFLSDLQQSITQSSHSAKL